MTQMEIMQFEKLPAKQKKRRQELEAFLIENLIKAFAVGNALREIRKDELYRSTHTTFEKYCIDLFEISRSRAYQLMDASEVVEVLSTNCGQIEMPKNEAQARPLIQYKKTPALQVEIWKETIEKAKDEKVTAQLVNRTIFEITGETVAKAVGTTRKSMRKDEKISKSFASAFEQLLQEIELAKSKKYQATTREAIVRHLDALRIVLAHDGESIPDEV